MPQRFDPDNRQPNDDLRRTTGVLSGFEEPRDNLGFDLLEIYNRNDYGLYTLTRDIWFALLNQGIRRVGVGNSDTHTLDLVRPGMPRNMVQVGAEEDSAAALTVTTFNRALAAGKSYATTGPLLSVAARRWDGRLDPDAAAGLGETLTASGRGRRLESHETASLGGTLVAPRGKILLDVTVRAAPWVPVDELRVFLNGEAVLKVPLATAPPAPGSGRRREDRPVMRLHRTFPIHFQEASWLVVEAGPASSVDPSTPPNPGGDYAIIAPAMYPLAFTNPIFIETGSGAECDSSDPRGRRVRRCDSAVRRQRSGSVRR
ncbi:MAG: hypothetical protein ACE5ID_06790 [Acidobacteriota bacterium]